jgi:hypothetical protein
MFGPQSSSVFVDKKMLRLGRYLVIGILCLSVLSYPETYRTGLRIKQAIQLLYAINLLVIFFQNGLLIKSLWLNLISRPT